MLVRSALGGSNFHTEASTGSHTALVRDASHTVAPPVFSRRGRIDAIMVPASRGAFALDGAANLAARLSVPLVALCSWRTSAVDAAERLNRVPGCQALVVDIPCRYHHDVLPVWTTSSRFRRASACRNSDLWLKRNLGLLLARLCGWGKILFLDDDIGDVVGACPWAFPRKRCAR